MVGGPSIAGCQRGVGSGAGIGSGEPKWVTGGRWPFIGWTCGWRARGRGAVHGCRRLRVCPPSGVVIVVALGAPRIEFSHAVLLVSRWRRYDRRVDNVTALVALISTSGTVLVALIGALSGVFGGRWMERRAAAEERERSADSERFLAAQYFAGALLRLARFSESESQLAADSARVDFVAKLRAGEGQIADFASALVTVVIESKADDANTTVTSGTDQLFAWLRGEIEAGQLSVHRGASHTAGRWITR